MFEKDPRVTVRTPNAPAGQADEGAKGVLELLRFPVKIQWLCSSYLPDQVLKKDFWSSLHLARSFVDGFL